MNTLKWTAIVLALAFGAHPAAAFKESPVGASQGEAAPAGSGFAGATPSKPAEKGIDIRIPGLGKLGVLPKLDFGLDILYGASQAKQLDAAPTGAPAGSGETRGTTEDGMTVRGSIKHRF